MSLNAFVRSPFSGKQLFSIRAGTTLMYLFVTTITGRGGEHGRALVTDGSTATPTPK